ncbi:hypothetical protein H310_07068 [Aphanomyces invadans]|uniref:Uncharacterized protein n=1 Tax=Aphanomyces invadans TaxID=157072 RepID=A0A024U3J2_9STRA|nr:hypothetical protein H310_07068 [Aphanomyces invadans]ETW00442.1 hypothetical protein H310_07068 [Aphanomyces invadans]|eukprot:XP_008870577.1 hypothetical protein H310_07068 [Aphanomyces invadans]
MVGKAKVTFHLPFIYGAKAKSTIAKEEQANRLDSFWFCEAQRPQTDIDGDVRVESAKPGKDNTYIIENRRLQSLLRRKKQHGHVKLCRAKRAPRPRIVDDLISLEHRYQKSAQCVQRAWRRYSARSFLQRYFAAVKAAITIQRHIRGVLCRKLVRLWNLSRLRFVAKIQAVYRGHLTRRVFQTQLAWETYNVNVIQKWTRGHCGRRRARAARNDLAAERIQCLWRGYHSRKLSDRKWLGVKATTIQSHMRRFLSQKRTQDQSQRYHAAAIAMQRLFRGTLARARVESMMRDRETHNRKVVMDVLDAEIAWQTTHLDKLQRRLDKSSLETKVVELEGELHRLHIKVNDMESIYIDMSDQKARMSPRAITDGWLSEMEDKMAKQRRRITNAKLDAVFGLGYTFKLDLATLNTHRERLARATFRKNQLVKWRTEEYIDYWTREMHHQAQVREEEFRRRVADQRRKWTVKVFTKSGKVQVHRPAPRVDTTFCMGNTNLLAGSAPTSDSTTHAIANLTDQVKLVTVQSQLAQATDMFAPLLHRFSSTHAAVHQMVQGCTSPARLPPQDSMLTTMASSPPRSPAKGDSTAAPRAAVAPTKPHAKSPTRGPSEDKPGPRSAAVPWQLLDQLEAEKTKFKTELIARKAGFTQHKRCSKKSPPTS